MSDTPRTDAKAQFFGWNPDEGEEFVTASFCRELERENAALRKDKERMDWLETTNGSDWAAMSLNEGNWIRRAAIDAARKEAQP